MRHQYVALLLAAAVFACTGVHTDGGGRAKGIHPVVDANGFLVGGTVDGRWLSSRKMASYVRGGERYRIYSQSVFVGTAVGSKPDRNLLVRLKPDRARQIAVAGTWNATPRRAVAQERSAAEYASAVRDLLVSKGLQKPQAGSLRTSRVDLDGDGKDELLIEAQSKNAPELRVGEYAIIALQTTTQGRQVTHLVVGDIHTPKTTNDLFRFYSLAGLWDLDGDGSLEIVASCLVPGLESHWTEIYKFSGRKTHLVAAVRPNWDYKLR